MDRNRDLVTDVLPGRFRVKTIIRGKSGHLQEAIADGEAALRVLTRDGGHYGAALYAYAVTLSRLGDSASVQRAADLLQEIERSFRGLRGLSLG